MISDAAIAELGKLRRVLAGKDPVEGGPRQTGSGMRAYSTLRAGSVMRMGSAMRAGSVMSPPSSRTTEVLVR